MGHLVDDIVAVGWFVNHGVAKKTRGYRKKKLVLLKWHIVCEFTSNTSDWAVMQEGLAHSASTHREEKDAIEMHK